MKSATGPMLSGGTMGSLATQFRYPPKTVRDLIGDSIRAFPDAPAILAPERESLSYAALGRQLDDATRALAEAGYGRGSRIAVALPDGPECALALLAVCSCATCAPLAPELDESTLSRLFAAMRIDALIAPEHAQSPAVQAARQAGVSILGLRTSPTLAAGTFEVVATPDRAPVAVEPPALDDVVLVTPTSGTTSAPKIVAHTNRRIAEAARVRAKLGQLTRHDRSLLATPVGNQATIRRALLPPLALGGSVVCVAHFEVSRFIDWLGEYAPTHYMASVATQIAILEELQRRPHPVRHVLRFTMSAGASLPTSVQSRLERALGVPVIQSYGMTETGSIAQVPLPPDRAPAGSTGRPTYEVAVTDDSGRALDPGELGEVTVRGPEVFDGYENDADATAAAFRDGWFRTGDLGRIDRDGFLFLAGRIKDVINRGGSKIAPVEVENLLASHPQVAQAAAFAMPHPTLGEDLAAAVVLRDNAALSEDELRNFARAHLASFKVPTRIITIAEFPRGSLDKVKRAELAAVAQQRLRVEFVAPRDPLEIAIAAIFAEELGVERVGAQDNFFQLGGDSLSCVRVIRSMAQAFGVDVDIDAFFATPTAAGLAAEIRNRKPS